VTFEVDIWALEGVTIYLLLCRKLRSCVVCLRDRSKDGLHRSKSSMNYKSLLRERE
jgi:hypothetical protein